MELRKESWVINQKLMNRDYIQRGLIKKTYMGTKKIINKTTEDRSVI